MIKVLIGNLFESRAKTLVNTVNCVGVMGKGVAQEFKKRFPDMFQDYAQHCAENKVKPGVPYLYEDLLGTSIINFPTKDHWRSASRLDDIIQGLDIFIEKVQDWDIQSVAFPPLGCGNGGLEWSIVGPLMYQKLSQVNISVEIYAPYGTPKQQLSTDYLSKSVATDKKQAHRSSQKKLTPEWVALLEVLYQLERQPYANPVGRTIFQKICYTMTEQKIQTGFKFKQGDYGPFSQDVKTALGVFANSNLIYEEQLGPMTALRIGSEYSSTREKYKEQLKSFQSKISRTTDLFSRIKDTSQAEEVTTIFYATRQLKKQETKKEISEQDVFDYIVNWKKRWDTQEKQESIASAIRNLVMLNWVNVKASDTLPLEEWDF